MENKTSRGPVKKEVNKSPNKKNVKKKKNTKKIKLSPKKILMIAGIALGAIAICVGIFFGVKLIKDNKVIAPQEIFEDFMSELPVDSNEAGKYLYEDSNLKMSATSFEYLVFQKISSNINYNILESSVVKNTDSASFTVNITSFDLTEYIKDVDKKLESDEEYHKVEDISARKTYRQDVILDGIQANIDKYVKVNTIVVRFIKVEKQYKLVCDEDLVKALLGLATD